MNQVERNVLMYAKLASEIGNLLGSAAKSFHKISPDIAQKATNELQFASIYFNQSSASSTTEHWSID